MKSNRSNQLLALIEELLNPDHDYEQKHRYKDDEGQEQYHLDVEHARPTHKILKDEADDHLYPDDTSSSAAKAAIAYSGSDYTHMNHLLRHGTLHPKSERYGKSESQYESQNEDMRVVTNHPTQHEFYGYRGVSGDHDLTGLKAGEIIHDRGFTSVSLRPRMATTFANHTDRGPGRLFRIHVKPGTRGHYLSAHNDIGGKSPREAEFVLHPGTKFRVGDSGVNLRGKHFTDLHIHSQEED